MKFFALTSLAALAAMAQAQLTINTPSNLVECQPSQLTWTGGTGPYFLSVQDGNNPSGSPLKQFPQEDSTSLTWTVDLSSGTSVSLLLRDNSGATAQSAPVTIQAGTSTDCH